MSNPKTYIAVLKHYDALKDASVKEYYDKLPELIDMFGLDIAIGYLFSRLELAHNIMLYCGLLKLHHCDNSVAESMISSWHITRDDFIDKFKNVFGHDMPVNIQDRIKEAEKVRDGIMHGKLTGRQITADKQRNAIVDILDYSIGLNSFVKQIAGFEPFGDKRGFKGRGQLLDKKTTAWIMKGMGF